MNMPSNLPAPDIAAHPRPVHARPAIWLQGASVIFGSGERSVTALSPTSLKLADGDFLALVGPSGCGESTFLRLVSSLIRPSPWLVPVGGHEAAAKQLRIGMAFQNPTMRP